MTPEFTQDWFSGREFQLMLWLGPFVGKPIHALEIGCFEGRSTVWFLERILTNADSSITCIDSFTGGFEHQGIDFSAVQERFLKNIEPWLNRVNLKIGPSAEVMSLIAHSVFDFIYVDGSHRADDVYQDAILAWPHLSAAGIMIFDDYLWDGVKDPSQVTKIGVDRFITESKANIVPSYQLAVSKL